MKMHMLVVLCFAFALAACGERNQAAPEQATKMKDDPPPVETAMVEAPESEAEDLRTAALIEHMHTHAEKLDDLNFALADGDLDAALTPAYWLSRHEEISGIPAEWNAYLIGMRAAALAVEAAPDIATARAAAEQISAQCQGCHAAAKARVSM